MAKNKVRKSIYGEQIEVLNVTEVLLDVLNQTEYPEWDFNLNSNWEEEIKNALKELDFHRYDYFFRSETYWCGILYAEPFGSLMEHYGEEEILNIIKDEHLKLVWTDEGLVLQFYNPTKSPLYRFFNKHKEDGYGLNVTTSVNELIGKVKQFLRTELSEQLESFGVWEPVEMEEDVA